MILALAPDGREPILVDTDDDTLSAKDLASLNMIVTMSKTHDSLCCYKDSMRELPEYAEAAKYVGEVSNRFAAMILTVSRDLYEAVSAQAEKKRAASRDEEAFDEAAERLSTVRWPTRTTQ